MWDFIWPPLTNQRQAEHPEKVFTRKSASGINSNEGLIPVLCELTAHNGEVPPYLCTAAVALAQQRRLSSTGQILLVCTGDIIHYLP